MKQVQPILSQAAFAPRRGAGVCRPRARRSVCMQRSETVVFLQALELGDGIKGFRTGPQGGEGLLGTL